MKRRWVMVLLACSMMLAIASVFWSPSRATGVSVVSEAITVDVIANPPP